MCNRREILSWLKEKTEENSKQDGFLNIVIGDIDLFKQVNDTYGHDAGDEVLKEISEVMERFMNGKGAAARWGGEEFLLVFTQANGDICAEQVEELRRIIEKKQINYLGQQIRITMTFGIQEHQTGDRVDHTITKADAKLYTGKKKGRNRVVFRKITHIIWIKRGNGRGRFLFLCMECRKKGRYNESMISEVKQLSVIRGFIILKIRYN